MRARDSYLAKNISATTSAFHLNGGIYSVDVVATFGGGSVKLQKVGPDGATSIDLKAAFDDGSSTEVDLVVGTFAANGNKVFSLAEGNYILTITTATAVYVSITRVPGE